MRRIIFFISLCLGVFLHCSVSFSQSTQNSSGIVVFPFNVENAGKYDVLKDGIRSMLISRLARKDGVHLVENSLSSIKQGLFLEADSTGKSLFFKELATEYIAAGSMFGSGEKLLLQVDIYSQQKSVPERVVMQIENEAEIIKGIEMLSQQIREKVLGQTSADILKPKSPVLDQGLDPFRTEHPDRKYKEEFVSGSTVVGEESSVAISQGDLIKRRSVLSTEIVSLTVGDADGDGVDEIFIASVKDVRVYHYEKGLLSELAVFKTDPAIKIHALNSVDMDKDGRIEIYVSAAGEDRFSSLILTWDKAGGFQNILENIRWAIRPVRLPDEGVVLLGQEKAASGESFLESGVHILNVESNTQRIVRGKQLFLPEGVNVFDFIFADINGDDQQEKVVIDRKMKMSIYDQENRLLWISEADFGGSMTYIGQRWRRKEGQPGRVFGDDENYLDLYYLPTRLIAEDVNNDGKEDVIVARNIPSIYKELSNLRSFKGGNVVCMSWNGNKMVEIWGTDTSDGLAADYSFFTGSVSNSGSSGKDKDNEIKPVRLFVGQTADTGITNLLTFSDQKAALLIYDFKIISKKRELSTE